jgi:hypothetical protein
VREIFALCARGLGFWSIALRLNDAGALAPTGAARSADRLVRADRQAYALLRKPEISKVVVANEKRRLDENRVSATRVIEENRRIGFNDPRRFIDSNGNLKPITDWTEDMASAVSKIEVVKKNAAAGDGHTDTVVKLWFWNKNAALFLQAT